MAGLNGYPGFISDILRGDTKDFVIEISRNGAAVDISGAKFVIVFKAEFDPEAPAIMTKTIDPPTDPTNGKTDGELTDTETLALSPGQLYYTVRYINPAGKAYVIDMGKIEVLQCLDKTIS